MKLLLLACVSFFLAACQAPRPATPSDPAPVARPEIRYYVIADT